MQSDTRKCRVRELFHSLFKHTQVIPWKWNIECVQISSGYQSWCDTIWIEHSNLIPVHLFLVYKWVKLKVPAQEPKKKQKKLKSFLPSPFLHPCRNALQTLISFAQQTQIQLSYSTYSWMHIEKTKVKLTTVKSGYYIDSCNVLSMEIYSGIRRAD